ncbi:MAG: flagellar biosynthesis protein FlaG [Aquificota bacterium]|nr:MAG: flagellar biosynthesis protein FlaG [Aquificota bacterium]
MRVSPNYIKVDIPMENPDMQFQKAQGTLENIRKEVENQRHKAQEVRAEELKKLLEEIRRKFDMLNKYLRIDIDTELEIPVAKIIERDTNRIVRQIPPEYLLDLMKKIDQMLGILLQREV